MYGSDTRDQQNNLKIINTMTNENWSIKGTTLEGNEFSEEYDKINDDMSDDEITEQINFTYSDLKSHGFSNLSIFKN